jgi:hypothetical protein
LLRVLGRFWNARYRRFGSDDSLPPLAAKPPVQSRFQLRPRQSHALPLQPRTPSDDDSGPLPKRRRPPQSPTTEINTDFIDRALSGAAPAFDLGVDDEDSPIRAAVPLADPGVDLATLRELVVRLPPCALGALTAFLRAQLAGMPDLPGRVAGADAEDLRREALAAVVRQAGAALEGALAVRAALAEAVEAGVGPVAVEEQIAELRRRRAEPGRAPQFNPYVALRAQLAFAVARLTKEPPAAVVAVRGERMAVSCSNAGWLHTQIAVAQRWRRFRSEFLALMAKVHGLMFADQVLSFTVVSVELRARFAVVLRVPTAYPWGKVAVAAVRIDFGLQLEETKRAVVEIARGIPMGDGWLTRFVDAVLEEYRAVG